MKHSLTYRTGISAAQWLICLAARLRWSLPLLIIAAGCLATGLRSQTSGPPGGEATLLEPDKTIERQLAGGQGHEFRFALNAGKYARVLVEQSSINVALMLFG